MKLQWLRTRQEAPRRPVMDGRAWLAVLVLLGLIASAALHIAIGSESAAASGHAHGGSIASIDGDEPCGSDQKGHNHGGICVGSGGCSLCVSVTPQATLVLSENGIEQGERTATFSGATIFPHFHPPKPSARV